MWYIYSLNRTTDTRAIHIMYLRFHILILNFINIYIYFLWKYLYRCFCDLINIIIALFFILFVPNIWKSKRSNKSLILVAFKNLFLDFPRGDLFCNLFSGQIYINVHTIVLLKNRLSIQDAMRSHKRSKRRPACQTGTAAPQLYI